MEKCFICEEAEAENLNLCSDCYALLFEGFKKEVEALKFLSKNGFIIVPNKDNISVEFLKPIKGSGYLELSKFFKVELSKNTDIFMESHQKKEGTVYNFAV